MDEKEKNGNSKKTELPLVKMELFVPEFAEIIEPTNLSATTVLPIFDRPVFPGSRITATTAFSSVTDQYVSNMKKLDLLRTEIKASSKTPTNNLTPPPPLKSQNNSQNNVISKFAKKKIVYFGPSAISDSHFIEEIVKAKERGEKYIILSLAKKPEEEFNLVNLSDLHTVGVLAQIEDATVNTTLARWEVSLLTISRVNLIALFRTLSGEKKVSFSPFVETPLPSSDSRLVRSLFMSIIAQVKKLVASDHPVFQDKLPLLQYHLSGRHVPQTIDFIAHFLGSVSTSKIQAILEEPNVLERLKKISVLLKAEVDVWGFNSAETTKENELLDPSKNVLTDFQSEIERGMLATKNSKNGFDSRVLPDKKKLEFTEKLSKWKHVPDFAMKVINEELARLRDLNPWSNPQEYYVSQNYLTWLCSMPWNTYTKDNLSIENAEKTLEKEHYGILDVKERILEFISVALLKGSLQGKILCLVGPPGVGKTSIGKSIANSLGRKLFRFSVGGMNDVAEIKGHRRTYVGAMPGKIIQGIKATETSNPVVLVDEIDKLSTRHDGDPSSALLEAFDPEQNNQFVDHYLDIPFDLSKVLFICTANTTETISRPLLDRMEVIEISGYFLEEKLAIAQQYLVPRLIKESGLGEYNLTFQEAALKKIISFYCRESGVRNLNKTIEKILHKVALKIAKDHSESKTTTFAITEANLEEFIGKPNFNSEKIYSITDHIPGLVTALAWNAVGGSTLFIEATIAGRASSSSGTVGVQATGKLGPVMKESVQVAQVVAWHLCQQYYETLTEDDEKDTKAKSFFERWLVRVHCTEAATSKEGPSAGVAITTCLCSLILQKPVPLDVAFTGEISLLGKIVPVGGIKEKIMAAQRGGIKKVILPYGNKSDYEELPEALRSGISAFFVQHYSEVFSLLFAPVVPQKANNRAKL